MKGARPLSDSEVNFLIKAMKNPRNKALVLLGIRTGYRIGELLSITVSSCTQYGKIRNSITVNRANMKGRMESRTIVLHDQAKKALEAMGVLEMDQNARLFPFTRQHAGRILGKAVKKAKLEGKISSHSFRKTFAKKVYHALDKDIISTQRAMGHRSLSSTASYLSFDQEAIDKAIKGV